MLYILAYFKLKLKYKILYRKLFSYICTNEYSSTHKYIGEDAYACEYKCAIIRDHFYAGVYIYVLIYYKWNLVVIVLRMVKEKSQHFVWAYSFFLFVYYSIITPNSYWYLKSLRSKATVEEDILMNEI